RRAGGAPGLSGNGEAGWNARGTGVAAGFAFGAGEWPAPDGLRLSKSHRFAICFHVKKFS
ncbi:hypothetical protein, partial [Pseudogulbenkiania ferrooxidans]|uniref:hypothetical protein n=1 Tax=Pseudogulbenkiania ferrooxidans TaxID=549169 RepID=UPI00256FABFE